MGHRPPRAGPAPTRPPPRPEELFAAGSGPDAFGARPRPRRAEAQRLGTLEEQLRLGRRVAVAYLLAAFVSAVGVGVAAWTADDALGVFVFLSWFAGSFCLLARRRARNAALAGQLCEELPVARVDRRIAELADAYLHDRITVEDFERDVAYVLRAHDDA